jgi:transcriptional regulator with XRE-family HTH domain
MIRKPKNVANEIDAHVGARLRLRRLLLGISQEKLGDALGLTFQQIQKYERGANRVGASRLYDLSKVLDVPVAYFFDAMPDETAAVMSSRLPGGAGALGEAPLDADVLLSRETTDLVRAYYSIEDSEVRRRALEFLRTVSESASLRRPGKQADPEPVADSMGAAEEEPAGDGKLPEEV